MTEAIYKVGDILEFTEVIPRQFGLRAGPIRGLVIKISKPGYEYLSYRLLVSGPMDDTIDMTLNWAFEKDIIPAAKRVGHIDISALMFMENDEPDYRTMFAAYSALDAANLRQELAGTYKENKMLKNENEVLKRENQELRSHNKELEQALSKSEAKAQSRLDEIASLMRKVDELENTNKKQKAECDEANHEVSRLRTVIGGLNDVIDDLNASKSEISDLFYSLKNALQTNDILEGANKLMKENERLSNENENLKAMNDELRKSIPEYNKLVLEHFACTEKIKKLEAENARYLQSMTCAEKQMTEAAKRIYEAREHMNVALCNNE